VTRPTFDELAAHHGFKGKPAAPRFRAVPTFTNEWVERGGDLAALRAAPRTMTHAQARAFARRLGVVVVLETPGGVPVATVTP